MPFDRKAARERVEKATPGPWVDGKYGAIRGGEPQEYTHGFARPQVALATAHEAITPEERDANTALIANCRIDLPAALDMLDEVERLIKEQTCRPNCRSQSPMPFGDRARSIQDRSCNCWKSHLLALLSGIKPVA